MDAHHAGRMMFAVYDIATRQCVSLGSSVAPQLPAGLASVDVGAVDFSTHEWDAATLTMVLRANGGARVSLAGESLRRRIGPARYRALTKARLDATTPLDTRVDLELFQQLLDRDRFVTVTDNGVRAILGTVADVLIAASLLSAGQRTNFLNATLALPVESEP